MITIPKKVEYSVAFIGYLSKNREKVISLKETAKSLFLPYRFLGQLATDLKKAGIIESREGKSGGYCLEPGWQNKNLFDLLEAIGENKKMVECGECSRSGECKMMKVWAKLELGMVKELKKIKLSNL